MHPSFHPLLAQTVFANCVEALESYSTADPTRQSDDPQVVELEIKLDHLYKLLSRWPEHLALPQQLQELVNKLTMILGQEGTDDKLGDRLEQGCLAILETCWIHGPASSL
ncbi:uncharacterized protein JCM15063_000872 [Sporobolomyces koalae]|uniref:uncharacterized protein n=1 Tax=Sporobolomyces koalae TaxID=500713 RepID=UPI00317FF77D